MTPELLESMFYEHFSPQKSASRYYWWRVKTQMFSTTVIIVDMFKRQIANLCYVKSHTQARWGRQ